MIERVATDQTAPLWVAVKFASTEEALAFAREMMGRLEAEEGEATAFRYGALAELVGGAPYPSAEAQTILDGVKKPR